MPDYNYTALDETGAVTKGVRFAESETELAAYLKQAGFILLEYRESSLRRILNFLENIQLGGVKRRDLIDFSNSMSVMLRAGVSVMNALSELRAELDNKYFRTVIGETMQSIEEGASLNEAMAKNPRVFPAMFVSAIEIGENTGRLDTIFMHLVRHLKRIDDLIKSTRKAMIYPSFVFAAMLLAAYVFLVVVFPKLISMLVEFEVPLPTITRVVMTISGIIQNYWLHIAGAVIIVVVLYVLAQKEERAKYGLDWCQMNIPGIRSLFIQIHLSFFMRYQALLLSAGVDMLRALELGTKSVKNLYLKKILNDCRRQILEGEQLSDAFRRSRIVPSMIIRMIKVGEESGTLDEQMEHVADQYNEELSRKIGMALALLEPLLIFMLAGLAIALIMGVMLPLYDLVSQLSSGAGGGE